MAAGLILPVSGPYVGTWNAFPMGILNDDGYELACILQGQEVSETDQWGMTLVEAIHRGQNWRCRIRGLEWNRGGLQSILQMFGSQGVPSGGVFKPIIAVASIGDRWTTYCNPLLLTSNLGSPPSGPITLTAVNAGFAPNSQTAFNMTSKVREMPQELVLIPYVANIAGVNFNVPFTTT